MIGAIESQRDRALASRDIVGDRQRASARTCCVGAKVTEIVQLIIADNAAGQLLTWESGSLTISENGPGNGG